MIDGTEEEFNFKDYSITSNLTLKAVYEVDQAYESYENFVSSMETTLKYEDGEITKPTQEEWEALKETFAALGEEYQTALENGTASETGSDLERALFLYDAVINKYGPDEFENFLRRPTSYVPPTPPTSESSESSSETSSSSSSESSKSSGEETSSSSASGVTSSSASSSGTTKENNGGNAGVIVGVSVAAALVLAGGVGAILYFTKKKKK